MWVNKSQEKLRKKFANGHYAALCCSCYACAHTINDIYVVVVFSFFFSQLKNGVTKNDGDQIYASKPQPFVASPYSFTA